MSLELCDVIINRAHAFRMRTWILYSLLAVAILGNVVNAGIYPNSPGSVTHFVHEEYYLTDDEAFQACISFATGYGYSQGFCHYSYFEVHSSHTNAVGMIVEAGWLQESASISRLGTFFYGQCISKTVDPQTGTCESPKEKPLSCPVLGNPISPLTGNKHQEEIDYTRVGSRGLEFIRYYSSQSIYSDSASVYSNDNYMGVNWRHNYSQKLKIIGDLGSRQVTMSRPSGRKFIFSEQNGLFAPDEDVSSSLVSITLNNGQPGWEYHTESDVREFYSEQGQLLSSQRINGVELTFEYSLDADLETLDRVTANSGGIIQFFYNVNRHIEKIITPDGNEIEYTYDTLNRLSKTGYLSSGTERNYKYENSVFPYHLTGLIDENGNRYATWNYDEMGRALSSEHASGVEKFIVDYTHYEDATNPRVSATNPLGKQTTYYFTEILGVKKVTQVEGHPTASCEGANKAYTYDTNGYIASKTDWKGVVTSYTRDSRGLVLSKTVATGTPEERTTTTEWHAQYRLPTKITEPGKITEFTYDTQGRQLSRTVRSNP